MIKEYVNWFCNFINVSYETSETLELWITSRKQKEVFEVGKIIISESKSEQISIFDFDIAI